MGAILLANLNWSNIHSDNIYVAQNYVPDPTNGKKIFFIGGCNHCHQSENADISTDAEVYLSGGYPFKIDYGTIYSSNISPDSLNGIGAWTLEDFSNAVRKGVSPLGNHYYPVFPYTSYSGLSDKDIIDLYFYLKTLPLSEEVNKKNDVNFPFSIRSLIIFWKLVNQNKASHVEENLEYGRYLVEHVGHCGECHTPRKFLGTIDYKYNLRGSKESKYLEGAPDIVSTKSNAYNWSLEELNEYLRSGFTPDYDSAGGSMAKVIENLSKVDDAETLAIATYLKYLHDVQSE